MFQSSFSFGPEPINTSKAKPNVHADYYLDKKLGSGTYGSVYLAKRKKDGLLFACKELPIGRVNSLASLNHEISIMKLLDHKNICSLIDHYQSRLYVHIILELCSGGEIFQKVVEQALHNVNEPYLQNLLFYLENL